MNNENFNLVFVIFQFFLVVTSAFTSHIILVLKKLQQNRKNLQIVSPRKVFELILVAHWLKTSSSAINNSKPILSFGIFSIMISNVHQLQMFRHIFMKSS